MSAETVSQNLARFLMVFGFVVVVVSFGVSIQKWAIVQDVWDRADTFEEPLEPATTTDSGVLSDWQDVQTIAGWETALRVLGLGSLLTSILLTFRMGIFKAAEVVQIGLPRFWQAYLAAIKGEPGAFREALDLDRREKVVS